MSSTESTKQQVKHLSKVRSDQLNNALQYSQTLAPSNLHHHLHSIEQFASPSLRSATISNGDRFEIGERRDLTDFSVSSIQFISDGLSIDDGGYETVSTSAILRYCKMKVLVPYFRLLSLLGWRQLISQNTLFENPLWIKLINLLYTLLILGFILSGYTLQYSYCYRQDGYRPYTDVKNSPSSPCCSSTPSTNILSVISEALGPKESVSSFNDVKSTNGSSILTNSQSKSTFFSYSLIVFFLFLPHFYINLYHLLCLLSYLLTQTCLTYI